MHACSPFLGGTQPLLIFVQRVNGSAVTDSCNLVRIQCNKPLPLAPLITQTVMILPGMLIYIVATCFLENMPGTAIPHSVQCFQTSGSILQACRTASKNHLPTH